MYKVIKDAGRTESIFLVNTETSGSINLGKISYRIMEILKGDGYDIVSTRTVGVDTEILTKDKWELKVSDEAKAKLMVLAMPMKKPIRKKVDKQPQKKEKKIVDALDIIYGLV